MRRGLVTLLLLAIALLALSVLSLAVGSVWIAPKRLLEVLWAAPSSGAAIPWERVVLVELRLPRALLAMLAGGGLGIAGAVMQGLFRNPMAEPGVLGVSAGSALGAVLTLYALPSMLSAYLVPAGAFVGAIGCTALVWLVGARAGRATTTSLLLAGLAVATCASAATSFVLSVALAEWEVGRQMLDWLMGGLEGRGWGSVAMATPMVLGGAVALVAHARTLDALLVGETTAMAVGIDVVRARRELVGFGALVTAASVASAGVIGFVGLIVPHVLRLLVGPRHRVLLPASLLGGAAFVLAADLACRIAPGDLRLGVLSGMLGGPFFVALLIRERRRQEATR
ncbi:MAG: iron chelate uptake ABC transporter family permease subunit [Myxococcales bacterium]|nr:iron chelate uptake ABC transporter family permease subunit [Myxococcales bacterium]